MNSSRNAEDLSEHCLQRIEDPANAMGHYANGSFTQS